MRSSILLTPRNTRTFHEFTHMATTDGSNNHGMTFYEDLYLKPHRKSTSMPCRNVARSSAENAIRTKRQSSAIETQRRSWSQSPINNPLLDSPPSARPLTLATNGKSKDNQPALLTSADDSDDNNNDYLRLSEATNMLPSPSKHKDAGNNVYENHPFHSANRKSRMSPHKSMQRQNNEHLYEVIPAQKQQQQQQQHSHSYYQRIRYFTDESNYILPSSVAEKSRGSIKQVQPPGLPNSKQTSTNLRSMRRIGRSVDSIKSVQGNRLRSQSTILAPQLWMKSARNPRLGCSASCDNIVGTELEFGRMPQSLTSNLEKENNNPHTCTAKSTRRNRLEEDVSSSRINDSSGTHKIRTAAIRSSQSGNKQPKYQHWHSSSYSGSLSAYENIEEIHKNLVLPTQESANYVNIRECHQAPDLNYADLDFTLPTQKERPKATTNDRKHLSATPTPAASSEESEDTVEYTLINIAATEAARLACAEHQQYRQRHSHSTRLSNA